MRPLCVIFATSYESVVIPKQKFFKFFVGCHNPAVLGSEIAKCMDVGITWTQVWIPSQPFTS